MGSARRLLDGLAVPVREPGRHREGARDVRRSRTRHQPLRARDDDRQRLRPPRGAPWPTPTSRSSKSRAKTPGPATPRRPCWDYVAAQEVSPLRFVTEIPDPQSGGISGESLRGGGQDERAGGSAAGARSPARASTSASAAGSSAQGVPGFLGVHLASRVIQVTTAPPQMTIGSPHMTHVGAFSQLHTATTIATHMTRPTMSKIVFFTTPPHRYSFLHDPPRR